MEKITMSWALIKLRTSSAALCEPSHRGALFVALHVQRKRLCKKGQQVAAQFSTLQHITACGTSVLSATNFKDCKPLPL
jgi:hypothetical protein